MENSTTHSPAPAATPGPEAATPTITDATQLPTYNPATELEKATGWQQFGATLYRENLILQAISEQERLSLLTPATAAEVPQAETVLATVKRRKQELEARRKETTSLLDGVTAALMQPEKNLQAAIATVEAATLTIKKIAAQKQREAQEKIDEITRLTTACKNFKLEQEHLMRVRILDGVTKLYTSALNDGVTPEEVTKWLSPYKKFPTEKYPFTPPHLSPVRVTPDEVKVLISQHAFWNVNDFVPMWEEELEKRFSDYSVAYLNKEEAAKAAKIAASKQAAESQTAKINAEAANNIAAMAQPTVVSEAGKDLKRTYKVDMPDSMASAMTVIAAFVANRDKCESKLRVKQFLKLGVDNMIVALESVKNADNAFAPAGLIFKVVEKL